MQQERLHPPPRPAVQVRLFGKHRGGAASRRQTGSDEGAELHRFNPPERRKKAAVAFWAALATNHGWEMNSDDFSARPSFPFLLNRLKIGFQPG